VSLRVPLHLEPRLSSASPGLQRLLLLDLRILRLILRTFDTWFLLANK
jgi:hypothetical protein